MLSPLLVIHERDLLLYRPPSPTRILTRAAETVKVPQMAESISEGTLKTWLKQVGDTVQQDEEVATIETDKVRFLLQFIISGAHMSRVVCTPYSPLAI